ncbi:MAG: hypothetical protein CSA36_04445 [Draconibacterium sp.]|nr:MAG: hypothetical protein CSA36_04445 [Draconibacterium sp.]
MRNLVKIITLLLIVIGCNQQPSSKVEIAVKSNSDLGEGALWNYKTGELLWIDITGEILNFYNPKTGINKPMFTGQMIGTVVPADNGQVLVALQNGIYGFDPATGSKKLIVDPEKDLPDNRFNDGKCDPAGRFWVGTMSIADKKEAGALYRFDADSSIHKMVSGVSISNGIAWSNDAQKMYYVDTPTHCVVQYDFNNATGDIANPSTIIEVPSELGSPDGMTIDEDGNLWIALWGGAAVGCWNPSTGELLRKVEVPAKNVTSCAFGGHDLRTLYITTARTGTSDEELQKYPDAGSVFKISPGVKGVKAFYFRPQN